MGMGGMGNGEWGHTALALASLILVGDVLGTWLDVLMMGGFKGRT